MMDRMAELDEMIAAGWDDMPGDQIPADWRTRKIPVLVSPWFADPACSRIPRSPQAPVDDLVQKVLDNESDRQYSAGKRAFKSGRQRKLQTPREQIVERKCAEMRERMRNQRRTA